MMDGYVDFLAKLFPVIDPYTARGAKDAMREFKRYGSKARFFSDPLDEDFQQGDIFSRVPFVYLDGKGQGQLAVLSGMLLNNSCDTTRNDWLQFAAMTPLDDYSTDAGKQEAVKSNKNFEYLYFPDTEVGDSFVNLGMISTISREAFDRFVASGKSERVHSLSAIGYFLFVTKLTVFFMRPEDSEVYASRGPETA
jgi:hypothetical protein